MLRIRDEYLDEIGAIHRVNQCAFGHNDEADLVDTLRERGAYILSLVAELDDQIVGHILFTPVLIAEGNLTIPAVGLGPLAVLPAYQKHGIGSALVQAGLAQLRAMHYCAAIVLGHPDFYPRFGFLPASQFGIRFMASVKDEVLLAVELQPGGLRNARGIVHYQPEFGKVFLGEQLS